MFAAGIDIGSHNTKLVVWDTEEKMIIFKKIINTGIEPLTVAESLLNEGLETLKQKRESIPVFSTGYGRKLMKGNFISEISCHSRGVSQLLPQSKTIIDIGGQDSKVISLDERHNIIEFAMNDKCAAGTGSFLEKVAELFKVSISSLGLLALQSNETVEISSTCVVFAESEIISLINQHISQKDILRGVHRSITKRIKNLLSNISWQPPVCLTGGVALNPAILQILADELQIEISVPEEPFFTGALGAAIFASEQQFSSEQFH